MNNDIFEIGYYNRFFDKYIQKFLKQGDSTTNENIQLKIYHSKNVQNNCRNIAISEKLEPIKLFTAELCGLFHDIGRFEQYIKYKTFRDSTSVYHGQIGVEVLNETNILKELPISISKIVLESVYNHGLFKIPKATEGENLYFSKLVRDADKIDIFRIVAGYYHSEGPRNIALEYSLVDIPKISNDVIGNFKKGELILKTQLKTLNDFKTMQLSWIFDMNFKYTKTIIEEHKYLESVLSTITDVENKKVIESVIKKMFTV